MERFSCGYFLSVNGTPRNRLARFNTNGALDSTFNQTAATAGYKPKRDAETRLRLFSPVDIRSHINDPKLSNTRGYHGFGW